MYDLFWNNVQTEFTHSFHLYLKLIVCNQKHKVFSCAQLLLEFQGSIHCHVFFICILMFRFAHLCGAQSCGPVLCAKPVL